MNFSFSCSKTAAACLSVGLIVAGLASFAVTPELIRLMAGLTLLAAGTTIVIIEFGEKILSVAEQKAHELANKHDGGDHGDGESAEVTPLVRTGTDSAGKD